MKRIYLGVLLGIGLISCNNDDNIQPVITLNGATDMTNSLNQSFVDPGATANDNIDGDISSNIVTTNNIDIDQVGEYHVYYNVSDSEGNNAAQATRNVKVINDADFLVGTYSVSANCSSSYYVLSDYTSVVSTSETVNNQILVDRFEYGDIFDSYYGTYNPNNDSLNFDSGQQTNYQGGHGIVTSTGFNLINYYSIQDFNTNCAAVRAYIKQ